MIQVRKSDERGHANHGWLDTYHTFSFAHYYDPSFTGFNDLLVINDDRVKAGTGFGRHGHKDMEIITYVLEGELEHKDSLGTGSVLRYGDIQRMSAGTGILHSEFNHSRETALHLLQIWIVPEKQGIQPGYEEKKVSRDEKKNRLKLIVSSDGRDGSLRMHQDASLYAAIIEEGKKIEFPVKKGRDVWIQMARGTVEVNGILLQQGDGAAVTEEQSLRFEGKQEAEILVFDLVHR